MKSFDEMEYHAKTEEIVKILCERTQNDNPLFFRVLVGYYWGVVASMMRCSIATPDRGNIPVNIYALNLNTSGSGKGLSMGIIENEIIDKFRRRYLDETFREAAEVNISKIGIRRAAKKGVDQDEEIMRTQKEFDSYGVPMFAFDSATTAAVKQLRHKYLMAEAGSLNLQIDEIGSNLLGNVDGLNVFLELYDVGTVKQKLVKNTAENVRGEEIHGRTPANMLLFGTPAKLLNGGKTEEELYSMLETGYARRCHFGYSRESNKRIDLTPNEVFDMLTNPTSNGILKAMSDHLDQMASTSNMNRQLIIKKPTSLLLIEYKLQCEKIAQSLAEHEEIKKAEISHRYFKALKLAGAYAFIDDSIELTEEHLYNAIKLTEESGEAFNQLLTRDRPYVKLAKYIATCKRDVTQADLVEDLPFYRGSASQKAELLNLAIAYGHKNNIIIKKTFSDGVEFLRGESLEPTDLSKLIVSWSTDIVQNYNNDRAPFEKLGTLTGKNGLHWVSHHLNGGYRNEENCIPGFNLVVIDVDGEATINEVQNLMKGYMYHIYTTKRHTPEENRFRIVMPTNFVLKLDHREYKEFMNNIYEWLPFKVDTATNQRARKWLSHSDENSVSIFNEGEVLDVLPFIPKTAKNEERKARLLEQSSMDNLERWVLNNSGDGNRNNMLLRYAMLLVDAGASLEILRERVLSLNAKMPDKLDNDEIQNTILVTATKALMKKHESK